MSQLIHPPSIFQQSHRERVGIQGNPIEGRSSQILDLGGCTTPGSRGLAARKIWYPATCTTEIQSPKGHSKERTKGSRKLVLVNVHLTTNSRYILSFLTSKIPIQFHVDSFWLEDVAVGCAKKQSFRLQSAPKRQGLR